MEAEIIRLMAAEVPPHHNILKEVDANEKREVYQAFDEKKPIII